MELLNDGHLRIAVGLTKEVTAVTVTIYDHCDVIAKAHCWMGYKET